MSSSFALAYASRIVICTHWDKIFLDKSFSLPFLIGRNSLLCPTRYGAIRYYRMVRTGHSLRSGSPSSIEEVKAEIEIEDILIEGSDNFCVFVMKEGLKYYVISFLPFELLIMEVRVCLSPTRLAVANNNQKTALCVRCIRFARRIGSYGFLVRYLKTSARSHLGTWNLMTGLHISIVLVQEEILLSDVRLIP